MSLARLVITAVVVEGQTVAEVAARYGVHRSWVYKLRARYDAEGDSGLLPRSRRPHRSPTSIPEPVVALIVGLRGQLTGAGLEGRCQIFCVRGRSV